MLPPDWRSGRPLTVVRRGAFRLLKYPVTSDLRGLSYTCHMARLLRIVLTWMLALALPIQGVAASTMLSCGQAHHQAALAAHGHAAPSDGHHVHEQSAAPDDGAAAGQSAAGKCSVCANCCSVAAIAASVPSFDVVPVAPGFGVGSFQWRAGITGGGLERPPRILLA